MWKEIQSKSAVNCTPNNWIQELHNFVPQPSFHQVFFRFFEEKFSNAVHDAFVIMCKLFARSSDWELLMIVCGHFRMNFLHVVVREHPSMLDKVVVETDIVVDFAVNLHSTELWSVETQNYVGKKCWHVVIKEEENLEHEIRSYNRQVWLPNRHF